jgi:hypothetical protein
VKEKAAVYEPKSNRANGLPGKYRDKRLLAALKNAKEYEKELLKKRRVD